MGIGFSLVEILMAVAVMAILSAVVIVAVRGAILKAHTTTCASNLRNLSVIANVYMIEHRNELPAATRTNDYDVWYTALGKDDDTYGSSFTCPQRVADYDIADPNKQTYSMNGLIGPTSLNGLASIQNATIPAETAFITDGTYTSSFSGFFAAFYPASQTFPEVAHNEGVNMLYLDGHVEYLPIADIPERPGTVEGKRFWRGIE